MTKLIVAFRNFANTPKNSQLIMYTEMITVLSENCEKYRNEVERT
jgi:hypothetical protein